MKANIIIAYIQIQMSIDCKVIKASKFLVQLKCEKRNNDEIDKIIEKYADNWEAEHGIWFTSVRIICLSL